MSRSCNRTAIAMCVLAILSACTVAEYPSSWSRLDTAQTGRSCPMIAGLYIDEGIQRHNPNDPSKGPCELSWDCSLSNYLFFKHIPRRQTKMASEMFPGVRPTHTEIIQLSDDLLEVVAWNGSGSTRKRLRGTRLIRDHGDFSCSPEGLKLRRRSASFGAQNIGGVSEWEDRFMTRSEDGRLVLKLDSGMIGLLLFFPMAARGSAWYRWEPAPPDAF
jgi:hypothetical protein